ncbi:MULTISPECIES: hypothetical protein [Paenibacillus]|uniref:hypothetical protein n=1 Tax=Paenibacillus TaxID=44249 RepID=UPI002FE2EB71
MDSKKDANLQAFLAILENRADFVENSCRIAGILKILAPNKKKHAHMQEFYVFKDDWRGTRACVPGGRLIETVESQA